MIEVFNFSGGRTSARLCAHAKQMFPNAVFIYMDTGAEHPETYNFIRAVNKHLDLNLICIRADINDTLGVGNEYEILDINDLKFDLEVWEKLVAKYSTPYSPGGAFCTDRMKTGPYRKYCKDMFGSAYRTWIGIRADEPKRLFGKDYNNLLTNCSYSQDEKLELYRELCEAEDNELEYLLDFNILDSVKVDKKNYKIAVNKCLAKITKARKLNYRYMAEILDDDELDVLDFWKEQPINLNLDKHKGNCVFCIKKTVGKLALAARDEPELAQQFIDVVTSPNVRQTDRELPSDIMYDGGNSLTGIIQMFKDVSNDDMRRKYLGLTPNENASGCTESCEMFATDD